MATSVVSILTDDGRTLTFDAVITYSLASDIDVTDHPIETGADVADHAQPKPKRLALRALISESPFDTVDTSGGLPRVQRAQEFLDSIAGKLVTLVTEVFGTLPNMTMTRYPATRGTLRHLDWDIEFKAVRLAEAGLVRIAPEAPATTAAAAGLPDKQDIGEQPTQDNAASVNGAAQAARDEGDKSYLLSLTEAFGIAP